MNSRILEKKDTIITEQINTINKQKEDLKKKDKQIELLGNIIDNQCNFIKECKNKNISNSIKNLSK